MGEKVVFLAFSNDHVATGGTKEVAACARCRNKTFLLVVTPGSFNTVQCACCQMELGKMGWAPED